MTDQAPSSTLRERDRRVSLAEGSAAARVQITIDRRRGIETPQWIKDLASGKVPEQP